MFPSLETRFRRFEELEQQLQDPAVQADIQRLLAIQREYGGLMKVAKAVRAYHTLEGDIAVAREMVDGESDPQARAYAEQELSQLQAILLFAYELADVFATRAITALLDLLVDEFLERVRQGDVHGRHAGIIDPVAKFWQTRLGHYV